MRLTRCVSPRGRAHSSHAQIARIKERIEEKEGIPPAQQKLIFGGKPMYVDAPRGSRSSPRRNDEKSAKDYGVTGGSVLHVRTAKHGALLTGSSCSSCGVVAHKDPGKQCTHDPPTPPNGVRCLDLPPPGPRGLWSIAKRICRAVSRPARYSGICSTESQVPHTRLGPLCAVPCMPAHRPLVAA